MTGPRIQAFLVVTLTLISACADRSVPVEIPFEVRLGDRPIACTDISDTPQLSDLRFYVYNVSLIDATGGKTTLLLTEDGKWQSERVALIDLEDGEGSCANGSAEINSSLSGQIAPGDYTGIAFEIGVPEDLNHADPVVADPPLNFSSMHWHWRSGYKFMRAGLVTDQDHVWLHLGSNRCEGTVGNIQGCAGSNRVRVRLQEFVYSRDTVVVDMAALFAGVDLEDGVGGDCSSGPAESGCAGPFGALGVDVETGEARDGSHIFGKSPIR